MKRFFALILLILMVLTCSMIALAEKIPCAEDYRSTKSITLMITKNVKVSDDITLRKGDKVKGIRFTSQKTYVEFAKGERVYVKNQYLMTLKGAKIPSLPSKVTTKSKFKMEGEVLPPGTKLKVKYWVFSKKGELLAVCQEGNIPKKFLK